MRKSLIALLACTTAACNDAPTASEPRTFVIAPAQQWSGGEIAITGFRSTDRLPVLVVGTDTVAVVRSDDSTMRATLPLSHSRTATVWWARGQDPDSIGTVAVVGLRQVDYLTGPIGGKLVSMFRGATPWVIGQNWGNGEQPGIIAANVTTGQTTLYSGLSAPAGAYGAGVSSQEDKFVLKDSSGALGAWRLWPTTSKVAEAVGTTTRQIFWLNDSIWLSNGNHLTRTYSANGGKVETQLEDPHSPRFSPDKTLILLSAGATGAAGALPVFDTRSGEIAFRIPALSWASGLAFTDDGSRIVGAGGFYNKTFIFMIDGATGATIDSLPFEGDPFDLRPDGATDRVFLFTQCSGDPRILVFETSPLRQVGVLPNAYRGTSCGVGSYIESVLAHDQVRNTLYLIRGGVPGERYTYDLLP